MLLGGGASASAQGWCGEFPLIHTLSGEKLLGMGQGGQPESEFCVHVCISFSIVYVNFGGQLLLAPQLICSQKREATDLSCKMSWAISQELKLFMQGIVYTAVH